MYKKVHAAVYIHSLVHIHGASPYLNRFSRVELLTGQLRREKERIASLIVGRRQREAKLVGELDSDEIYDPDDEGVLSMREAQRESRRRIRALCMGRKLADCTTLLIDDLIRELMTIMTRCEVARAPNCGCVHIDRRA